ncbi:unnamed protein product [Brachionus calyciflorus]|uniref:Glycosyl transferase CAP10 domain-containing protein n=1 Tax=Brachionus calyciflorus TaxID=104777 RepID=A0A813R7N2_9BILA|nr:unnamed protein product [Brachionus calyciflorus]
MICLFRLILARLILLKFCYDQVVALDNFNIYGPGLNPEFNLHVRYFFIKVLNISKPGTNITKNYFQIKFYEDANNEPISIRQEILDRHDGVFIIRFKIYKSYQNLLISIKDPNGNHLDKSPYHLKGYISPDNCECIENDVERWYESLQCNQTYPQIDKDLEKFSRSKLDMNKLGKTIINKYNQKYSQAFCNYVIKNNQVYRKCYGEHIGFNTFSDNIFNSLVRKVKIPDVEFFMNLGDWPLNEKSQNILLPIISWCGSTDSNDMILPTYDLTESTLEMMGRQSLDIMTVFENSLPDWNEKINRTFWRGRDSRRERLDLIDMSRENPDLIDAGLTNLFFFREPEHIKKYGQLYHRTSFFDFFKYKYQINMDGTVAAYRFPYLISGNSLVLKQESKFYEHFYRDLKPYEHYVPFKKDLSDLKEKIEWVMSNDEKVRKIAVNAQNYAKEYLMPNHIFCYHVKFFMAYSKLLVSKVVIRDEMERVTQPNSINCVCDKQSQKNDKAEL